MYLLFLYYVSDIVLGIKYKMMNKKSVDPAVQTLQFIEIIIFF